MQRSWLITGTESSVNHRISAHCRTRLPSVTTAIDVVIAGGESSSANQEDAEAGGIIANAMPRIETCRFGGMIARS
jgi:hypothetical protein